MPGNSLLSEAQMDVLAGKVRTLLTELGYEVAHDRSLELLRKRGLKLSSTGRLLFDVALIDEFVEFQTNRTASKERETRAAVFRGGSDKFRTTFGNMVSKYHDYPSMSSQNATMEHLDRVVKYAHMEERVSRVTLPFSVTDVPHPTAPIDAFLRMVRLTDKYGCSLDPYSPGLVKHFAELSDVFLGPGKRNEFIDPCNCINPIMRLEERTAATMLEKSGYGVDSLMTSMPAAGGNSPVTLDGTILLGTAEILGGLIISFLLNPDVDHIGYISSGAMDFRTATMTQSSPETVQVDCGVVSLMNHSFGGNTRVGGKSYVQATQPGLQAVFEKMYKTAAYQIYSHGSTDSGILTFDGRGVLGNGSLFSPEQFILDMDIAESYDHLRTIVVNDDGIEDIIMDVAGEGRGDFLSTDHTLANYRDAFWEPSLLLRGETKSEREILDSAHQKFSQTVDGYVGYDFDTEKMAAGEMILAGAQAEML